ncbi:hypothetical protein ACH40F_07800 [Streptomyces sp. NPDC020794]|uniref:hypothetical protein n=1 Tax=unclassified Streptomyces TaxID=2593676 RepID=UPI0036E2FDC4
MTSDGDSTPVAAEPLTAEAALANAARLLHNAEMVTDHALMARLESLADSWIAIARTIVERS